MDEVMGNHLWNKNFKGTLGRSLPILLACIPIIFLFLTIREYRVDLPYADQWEFVPLLEKSYQGKITLADLAVQHNEHRYIFPRLIWLGLAHLTDWNICVEILTNFFLCVLTFILIGLQLKKTARQFDEPNLIWIIPFWSMIFFSINQWANWFWGWQLGIFLNVFCIIYVLFLLGQRTLNWYRVSAAIVLSVIASFSFANGLWIWLIGGLMLLAPRQDFSYKNRWISFGAWILAAAAVFVCYFSHFQHLPHHQPLLANISRPFDLISYFFAYLGNAFSNHLATSCAWGVFGLTFFLLLVWVLLKRKIDLFLLMPYLGVSSYVILTAGITAIYRVGAGPGQALSSRYSTFTNLFWMTLVLMFFLTLSSYSKKTIFNSVELLVSVKGFLLFLILFVNIYLLFFIKSRLFNYFSGLLTVIVFAVILSKFLPLFSRIHREQKNPKIIFIAILLFLGILTISHVGMSVENLAQVQKHGYKLKKLQVRLRKNRKCPGLKYLYKPNPDKVRKYIKKLHRRRLSLFREPNG